MNSKVLGKILVFASILIVGYFINKYGLLRRMLDWIDAFGPWGMAVFLAVYVATAIFFVPSFVFTFAGGVLFGFWRGLPLALIGSGLGSVGAFLIGRYLVRDMVARAFARNEKFQLLDKAVQRKGWKIVILARLTPIFPFLVANYGFGSTRISAWHYFLASVIGTIPSASVYTYMGSVTGDLATIDLVNRTRTPAEWALLIGGLFVTMALVYYIRRVAQHALRDDLET